VSALLELDDVHVAYPLRRGALDVLRRRGRRSVHALDGVSLRVGAGELVALVGESGCGKSTLGQAALGLVEVDRGRVRFAGRDVTAARGAALRGLRRELQLVFQDPFESLDPRFSVRGTVEEPLLVHGVGGSAAERLERVTQALDRAGLRPPAAFLSRRPHELSGGQRQRVAIAASLVLEPRVLVADEPVSMLDVSVRADVLALLDALRADGLGILMITHDLSTAARCADRIVVMYLGRVVEEGPSAVVMAEPRHPYTRALLSVIPPADPLAVHEPRILEGEPPDAVHVPKGCRFHPRCPSAAPACEGIDPRLEPVHPAGQRAACIRLG